MASMIYIQYLIKKTEGGEVLYASTKGFRKKKSKLQERMRRISR
jgi:hypothetical protein